MPIAAIVITRVASQPKLASAIDNTNSLTTIFPARARDDAVHDGAPERRFDRIDRRKVEHFA